MIKCYNKSTENGSIMQLLKIIITKTLKKLSQMEEETKCYFCFDFPTSHINYVY